MAAAWGKHTAASVSLLLSKFSFGFSWLPSNPITVAYCIILMSEFVSFFPSWMIGGLSGGTEEQMHAERRGMQVRPSPGTCRNSKRPRHSLLRLYQGTKKSCIFSLHFCGFFTGCGGQKKHSFCLLSRPRHHALKSRAPCMFLSVDCYSVCFFVDHYLIPQGNLENCNDWATFSSWSCFFLEKKVSDYIRPSLRGWKNSKE